LERHIDELQTTVIRLRREIKNKQGHVGRLTILVQQRSNTIDDLRGNWNNHGSKSGSSTRRPIISPHWCGCREAASK